MPDPRPRKLKRVIIREEYVALTGSYTRAILLHQLEYRQKCAFDVDRYLAEEAERLAGEGITANILPENGWFYKKAAELAEETMLGLDETTIRRHLKFFTERGWIDERHNPRKRWDRTMQYRLNLVKIKADLEAINYQLQDWLLPEPLTFLDSTSGALQQGGGIMPDGSCISQDRSGDMQLPSCVLQEQYQNKSLEHKEEQIHNAGKAAECVSRSRYSSEEIARYLDDCARRGQAIYGGLAFWLRDTGKGDSMIEAFLEREKRAGKHAKQRLAHPHNCPGCFGSQMEIIPGKGARSCTHTAPVSGCEN